ncbi:MAG TPA: MarR family transcriptional regulator [Blastocatellia bacterium]|nr:MarR family transcriptional regulator [Blastocatellia bacterium]
MLNLSEAKTEEMLDRFAEALFRLMIVRHQRNLAEAELTMVQAQVLRLVDQRKSLSTGDIAIELGVSAPAVTQLTDRLIRKRLIDRRPAPEDRRSVMVTLSARGKRALFHFNEHRGEIFNAALERLSEPDRQSALEAISKLLMALEPEEAKTALSGKGASKLLEEGGSR